MGRQGTPRPDATGTSASRRVSTYVRAHRARRRWLGVVGVLAAVVACVTALALSLPASTWTGAASLPEGAQVPEGYTRQYSAQDRDSGVAVAVHAADGVVPDGAQLKVDLLDEDGEKYGAARDALAEQAGEGDDYGFAALDIRFEDEKGNEVEPTGDVYVVIDAKSVLPEDVDPESVTVQHLAEDESGAVAAVDTVADAAEVTDGVVAANDTAVQAAFTVDGFSTFTITWNNNRVSLEVYLGTLDGEGNVNELDVSDDIAAAIFKSDETIASFDAPKVSGYEYAEQAYVVSSGWFGPTSTERIYDLEYVDSLFGSNWQYTTKENPSSQWDWETYDEDSDTIYFIYEESSQSTSGLSVTDDIFNSGSLKAVLTNDDNQVVSYTWYRSQEPEQNSNYELVDGQTSESIYVADDGARHYYYVEANLSDGTQLTSDTFQVPYYDALQNGSFEDPDRSEVDEEYQLSFPSNGGRSYFMQIPNDTDGLIWKTTGYGTHYGNQPNGYYTEIVKSTYGNSRYAYGIPNAAEGDQFAELNCQVAGALYQDVLTVPGSTLYWGLEHSDRSEGQESRLLVLISDTSELPDNFNPADYRDITGADLEDNIVLDVSTEEVGWQYHAGSYVVPEGQYVTRFYFVAGNGASEGNLLDNITFRTELPKPPEEKSNIVIRKSVTGVDNTSDLAGVGFTFSVTGENYSQTVEVNEENNWTAIVTVDPGLYNVLEQSPAQSIGGYSYLSTQVSVDEGSPTSDTSTMVSAVSGESVAVDFTNTYTSSAPVEPTVSDPDIRKYVDAKDDGTYDLSLDVTGTTGKETRDVNVLYILDESYSMMWDMNGNYPDKEKGTDEGDPNPSGDNKYPNKNDDEQEYLYSYARFNAAKQAITQLNSALLDDANLDVQVAMVTFAFDHHKPESYEGQSIGWNDLSDSFDLPSSEWETFASGTNYAEAFGKAKTILSDARSDAETIVVFVTDGEPNYPQKEGMNDAEKIAYAKQQAAKAIGELECDRFYAVGVGSDIGNDYLSELVENVKEDVVADSFASGRTSEIINHFNEIAAEISGVDTHDVTIVDELSEYAELVDTSSVPTITIKDANGFSVDVAQPETLTESNDGVLIGTYTFNDKTDASSGTAAQQTLTYTYYPAGTYQGNEHPVIKLDFPEKYALTKGWTYTITVSIQPTQDAVDYLLDNDNAYPEKGDPNTDVPGTSEKEWTSSGKLGFNSNKDATLIFTSGKTTMEPKYYPDPVIQVTTRSLSFKKVDATSKETALTGAEFILSKVINEDTLYLTEGGSWSESKDTAKHFGGKDISEFTINNLVVGETYELIEVVPPDGYQLLEYPVVISGNAAAPTYNSASLQPESTAQDAEPAGSEQNPYLIPNSTGAELPETGGPGTTIATFGGATLIAAAGIGYGLRRNRERRGAQS